DADLPRARLSARLWHRAGEPPLARPAASARHAAVLDLVPAARLRVEGAAPAVRRAQPGAARRRPDRRASAPALYVRRGLSRRRLRLPAFHGPAALREPRATRAGAAGGRRGSGRTALRRVLARDAAALAAWDR